MRPAVAERLRAAGYDVISSHEAGMLRASDEEQLAHAASMNRALVTFNYRDFRRIATDAAERGEHHAGIVISYRQYTTAETGALVLALSDFLETVPAEQLANALLVLPRPRR